MHLTSEKWYSYENLIVDHQQFVVNFTVRILYVLLSIKCLRITAV